MRFLTGYDIVLYPILTEKSQKFQVHGKYVFKVHPKSTKVQVKKAVESIFKIEVLSVNVLRRPSKSKSFKGKDGLRSGFKKCIITILGKKNIELGA
jgi:large subunit ribosomal protein L23